MDRLAAAADLTIPQPDPPMTLAIVTSIAAVLWVLQALWMLLARRELEPLARQAPALLAPPGGWPLVTVVVPCRDEERRVGTAVRSLLAQDYPALEVIAVDDRSSDSTGAILDEIAREDDLLRVLHLPELATGWLGKPHAQHQASRLARGEWLLFTDADVEHHPMLLRTAVSRCLERGAEYITLVPHNDTRSLLMRLVFAQTIASMVSLLGLWLRPLRGRSPHRRQGWATGGTGGFILMSRDLYERVGGHEAIRRDVVDDVALGLLAGRSGAHCEIAIGGAWCRVPWARSYRELLEVTSKNGFAIAGFRWSALVALSVVSLAINTVAPLASLLCPALWPAAIAIWAGIFTTYAVVAPVVDAPVWGAALHPITSALLLGAGWNSAVRITRRGGVVWRGRFHPLRELRRRPGATRGIADSAPVRNRR